ncbi:TonB-dependent receptor, partial [Arthrospira platensis SPKY1]|nr:TonB-dependent receptor [Arthrospira platensis SPKY1]
MHRRFGLHAGLYGNRTQYRLSDLFPQDSLDISGDRAFPAVWSPRLSALYRAGAMAAFATLSHGSNFPTLEETLAPDGAINPAILPERGWNAELGLRRLPGEGAFYYELSLFHLWIRDLL